MEIIKGINLLFQLVYLSLIILLKGITLFSFTFCSTWNHLLYSVFTCKKIYTDLIILSIRNNPVLFMYILQKDSHSSLTLVYRVLYLDKRVSHLLHNTYNNFLCRITQPLQKLSYMFNNFIHSPFYFQRIFLRLFHDHCYTSIIRFKYVYTDLL